MKVFKNKVVLSCLALLAFACNQNTSSTVKQGDFYVRGNCGMCEERIEKAVKDINGVVKADWNVETKSLSVSYDSTKTTEVDIRKTVANVGHETKTEASPQAVHDALPECCKKGSSM